ncbi:MAG: response regulator [Spirochaetia bacterium]|nr:response regulator [Spirochaetia bacterium]
MLRSLLLCLLTLVSCVEQPVSVEATRGRVQTRAISHIIALTGEWDFYWDRLLLPEELQRFEPAFLAQPATWRRFWVNNAELDGTGKATMHLRVFLEPSGEELALRVPPIGTASQVFVNGKLVQVSGKVGDSEETTIPKIRQRILPVRAENGSIDLTVQMANFADRQGGPWGTFLLGPASEIYRRHQIATGAQVALAGAAFILGLLHLGAFALRRKDRASILFGIFCVLVALRAIVSGQRVLLDWCPALPFQLTFRAEYISGYLLLPFFMTCYRRIFPLDVSPLIANAFSIVGIILTAAVIFLPSLWFTQTLNFFSGLVLTAAAYVMFTTFVALLKRRAGAKIAVFGLLTLSGAVILAILDISSSIDSKTLLPLGLILSLGSFTIILSTRRARTTIETADAARALSQANFLKEQVFQGLSRELATPLRGILGLCEHLLDTTDPADPNRNLYEMISHSSRRVHALMQDVVDLTRIQNGDLQLDKKSVDIKTAVDIVIYSLTGLSQKHGIVIQNRVTSSLIVHGDEYRIQQILLNLIAYAVKQTDLRVIEVRGIGKGAIVEVTIVAGNAHIPDSRLETIFEPFVTLEGNEHEASGLGLAICKRLVDLHAGQITAERADGSWYFLLKLPTGYAPAEKPARKYAGLSMLELAAPSLLLGNGRTQDMSTILIVDDEPINRELLSDLLKKDYNVWNAESGMAALGMISDGFAPDMVILDIMMPHMSGLDVCREIRKARASFELPIILLSALNSIQDITAGFDAGANDYVTKPFERRELLARVHSHISLKHLAKENKELVLRELESKLKLERERIRVYRDLHDGVAAELNAILLACRIARRNTDTTIEASNLLSSIERASRLGLEDIRDILDAESVESVELDYFLVWSGSYARQTLTAAGLEGRVDVATDAPEFRLGAWQAAHLKKILKEIIQNIIKHAEASRVDVSITVEGSKLFLSIQDNGKGFDPDHLEIGRGLDNLRKRSAEAGGNIKWSSQPGKGSGFFFELRLG